MSERVGVTALVERACLRWIDPTPEGPISTFPAHFSMYDHGCQGPPNASKATYLPDRLSPLEV